MSAELLRHASMRSTSRLRMNIAPELCKALGSASLLRVLPLLAIIFTTSITWEAGQHGAKCAQHNLVQPCRGG